MKFFFAQEHAPLAKQFDNVWVRVENVLAGQVRQTGFISETAMIINGRQDRQTLFHSQNVIVGTVAGRDVNGASSRVHRDKTGRENRDLTIQKWMARLNAFKIGPRK